MLSKNKAKFIESLKKKKERDLNSLFIVEGEKMAKEALDSGWAIQTVVSTSEKWCEKFSNSETILVSENELKKISSLQQPNQILLVVHQKEHFLPEELKSLSLYLDGVRDPGNLGTIIRIANWYGIEQLFLSPDCVEVYNPKVIQSTMGAIFRVKCLSIEAKKLKHQFDKVNWIGAYLGGTDAYNYSWKENGVLVMGSESHGIRSEIEGFINDKVTIPGVNEMESLNVSVATAILCSEHFKQHR